MDHWNLEERPVKKGYPPHEVQVHCVQNKAWQAIRLSMKGMSTTEKLETLAAYYDKWRDFYPAEVQVGNYLGALRRGGQLDAQNRVQR